MANYRTNHRRRSQSSPTHRRKSPDSPSGLWRTHGGATKRAHPQASLLSGCSPSASGQMPDTDDWRVKRRKRNASSSPESIERPGSSGWSFASSSSNDFIAPTFATTAAEFGLYPERIQSTRTRRSLPKHTDTSSSDLSSSHERATSDDLHRLQSDAFWELHRSIAENGEGFVRRMRDYEHSISHVDNAEGALARGRRRSPSSGYSLSSGSLGAALDGDASEEEDVQIFADDLSLSRSDSRRSRSHEMNIDNDHSSSVFGSERCYSSSQSSDVDDLSSHPYTHSGRSEADSLSLVAPMASLSQSVSPLSWPDVSSPSSSKSEKALAALGLAMANGAGNMSDYNALIAFQSAHASQPQYDEVGELWH